jgi:phage terminase large subunit
MASLDWFPQEVFAPHFLTSAKEILEQRSVFTPDIIYHVDYGGRGGAKTWTWADAIVVEASIRKVRILVTREFQISIEESIKDEIEDAITNRGLDHFFRCTKTAIIGLNGSKFIFKGIKNNIKNLKSISDVDIVLCEEAENIQKDSWEKLLPSIRPKSGRDPIFIILFNPDEELGDTYQRWVVNPPPQSLVIKVNWSDNKYFPDFLNKQRLHCLKTQPKRSYDHIWEGFPTGAEGDVIIDLEWVKAARFVSRHKDWVNAGEKSVAYDPAGQGRDANAATYQNGNVVSEIDEWVKSDDLREASKRALKIAISNRAKRFTFDSCGGFGDGVEVFIDDEIGSIRSEFKSIIEKSKNKEEIERVKKDLDWLRSMVIFPFDAGSPVVHPDREIPGTNKTWREQYTNAKAQAHAITAQKFYNTYRFIKLGERDIDPEEMISLDVEDDTFFNQIARELSTPIWEKSATTSKKKVESKDKMKKRTGQVSPNIADSIIMNSAPQMINKIHIG